MISRTHFHLMILLRQIWVRIALCSLAAIVCALLGALVDTYMPLKWQLAKDIGADALENVLGILASSMLTVATFSLSALVSAYATVDASATPRASNLLIQNSTAQNALALFIGAFVYSIVGLIALSSGLYGTGGRIMLMLGTVAMILVILATFMRWINQLALMGRPIHTINRVELAAETAIDQRVHDPLLGGAPLPAQFANVASVHGEKIGYVQYVDTAELQHLAEDGGFELCVAELPGAFSTPERPLLYANQPLDEAVQHKLRAAFVIGDMRTFEQDPRFGLIVLNEIGLRALSASINDPGTAIDIIGTVVRLLGRWAQGMQTYQEDPKDPLYPRVYVPAIEEKDLFEDIFPSLSRDGAGLLEVGIRLQKGLGTLGKLGYAPFDEPARLHAREALERGDLALALPADRARLHAASVFDHGLPAPPLASTG